MQGGSEEDVERDNFWALLADLEMHVSGEPGPGAVI